MAILCFIISILITFVFPIILMVYVSLRKKEYAKPFWFGFLTFTIFQIFTRIPLLTLLSANPSFTLFAQNNILLYSLLLGFSAALFEEMGRFIVMYFGLRKHQTTKDAIIFGVGHWACEALILVGLSYVLQAVFYGMFGIDASVIFGGLERIFVLPIHVAASIMVMHFVRERQISYLFMALAMHTIIDAALIPLQILFTNNILLIEGYVLVAGLLASYYIYSYIKKRGV